MENLKNLYKDNLFRKILSEDYIWGVVLPLYSYPFSLKIFVVSLEKYDIEEDFNIYAFNKLFQACSTNIYKTYHQLSSAVMSKDISFEYVIVSNNSNYDNYLNIPNVFKSDYVKDNQAIFINHKNYTGVITQGYDTCLGVEFFKESCFLVNI
jgi:hypothetical protein